MNSLLPIWTLASCSSAHPLKAWYHPSWSYGLIAHYSGEVDLMTGISYLLDLVDLPCGGVGGGCLLIRSLHYIIYVPVSDPGGYFPAACSEFTPSVQQTP